MQNWRVSITLTLGIILLAGYRTSALPESICDDRTARLVARAYVLSIPLFFKQDDLIPLMAENRAYFLEGGKVIRCMQARSMALMQGALSAAEQNTRYSATERFGGSMPEGLEHLPGQVDASMRSYGNDMFTMGQELLWLSQVLPPAAEEDYEPYNTTATQNRQMMAQALPILQMLCQMDPRTCQLMQNMLAEIQPLLEQQIYDLARQVND